MKRILGLDLGRRTVGVALSDLSGFLASPLTTVRFAENDFNFAANQVVQLYSQYRAEGVVLGLPRHMNGDIGESGQMALDFKELLEQLGIDTVVMWDERLTTVAAQRTLIAVDKSRKKRKAIIDQVAAVGILQSYLDSKAKGG